MSRTQSFNWDNGVLFSRKQASSVTSVISHVLCSAVQQCPAMYTHVSLLYDGCVYEASLVHGVQVTSFNDAVHCYETYLPLPELDDVDFHFAYMLDTLTTEHSVNCVRFVRKALALAHVNTHGCITPDHVYVSLTLP